MKGPKSWDYINQYKRAADGQYVYQGNVYYLNGFDTQRLKITVLWLLCLAVTVGSGFINAAGMNNSFYVILPYIAEVICAFVLSWQTFRLLWSKGVLKEYYYNKYSNNVPAALFMLCVFSAGGVVASIVFLSLHGFGGKPFQSVLYPALKLLNLGVGIFYYRYFKTLSWEKKEQ